MKASTGSMYILSWKLVVIFYLIGIADFFFTTPMLLNVDDVTAIHDIGCVWYLIVNKTLYNPDWFYPGFEEWLTNHNIEDYLVEGHVFILYSKVIYISTVLSTKAVALIIFFRLPHNKLLIEIKQNVSKIDSYSLCYYSLLVKPTWHLIIRLFLRGFLKLSAISPSSYIF